jgi:sec-independent protein translocase protein TatA
MGDVAKGIKSFKKGMAEDDTAPEKDAPRTLEHEARSGEARRDGTKSS